MKTVTKIILDYLDNEDKSQAHVSRKLKIKQSNLSKRLARKDMGVVFISRLSDALNHDFFEDLSKEWKRGKFDVTGHVMEDSAPYGNNKGILEKLVEEEVKKHLKK